MTLAITLTKGQQIAIVSIAALDVSFNRHKPGPGCTVRRVGNGKDFSPQVTKFQRIENAIDL